MNGETFVNQADTFLRANARDVLQQFLLGSPQGTWHPNGFAVFQIGDIAGLGRLRLHVWARGKRVGLKGQPAVHSHPWDVCSLVIGGSYQDILYEAREFDTTGPNRLRGYGIRFGNTGEGDQLSMSPKWYEVSATEQRIVPEGTYHYMPAGVLHETRIPLDGFAATILITSESVDIGKLLLLGEDTFDGVKYVRPDVSVDDLDQMKTDLGRAKI